MTTLTTSPSWRKRKLETLEEKAIAERAFLEDVDASRVHSHHSEITTYLAKSAWEVVTEVTGLCDGSSCFTHYTLSIV